MEAAIEQRVIAGKISAAKRKQKQIELICQQFIGHKNYNLTNHF